MEIEHFINRLAESARWLYYKPWERFELMSLGLIVTSLLMVIARSRENIGRSRESEQGGHFRNFRNL